METQIFLQDSPGMEWLLAKTVVVYVDNVLWGLMSSFSILLKALLAFMVDAQIAW